MKLLCKMALYQHFTRLGYWDRSDSTSIGCAGQQKAAPKGRIIGNPH
jgi:hypothetical protein